MPEAPRGQQSEQFKTKIEQGVERALPAEQVQNLKEELKTETEKNNKLKQDVRNIIKSAFNTEKTNDLAITPEEKITVFNYIKAQLTSRLGAETANSVMRKFGIDTSEKLIYRIGLRSIEEQRLYERFNNFLKDKPGYIFGFAKQIKASPWGNKMMLQAAEKAPESAFFYFKEFADMPGDTAKQILLTCTEKNPELAFKYINNYKDIEGAEDVLKVAILKTKNKEIVFEKIEQIKTITNAVAVLSVALPFLKNKNDAFHHIDKYADIEGAETVLINALMMGASPVTAFSTDNMPNAQAILVLAASLDPKSAYESYESYSKILPNNGSNEVIKAAVSANPDLTFENIGLLKGISPELAKFAIINAIEKKPEEAFAKLESYKDLPKESVNAILTLGAELNPAAAILNYDKYNDQNILKIAAQNIRPMDLFNKDVINLLKTKLENGPFKDNLLKEFAAQTKECRELGEDILKHKHLAKTDAFGRLERDITDPKDFFQDPALQSILKIKTDWIKPIPKDTTINDARVIIARNLHFKKTQPSEESVKKEWQKILENKERYKNLALFKNRSVIILADNEQFGDQYAHGGQRLENGIKNQGVKSFDFIRADFEINQLKDRLFAADKTKIQVSNKIINSKSPLSFLYTGHTGPNSLTIDKTLLDSINSDIKDLKDSLKTTKTQNEITDLNKLILQYEKLKPRVQISDREFAEILKQRNIKYPDEYRNINTRPIITLTSCMGSEFMRNVYSILTKSHPLPIVIATAEYKTYSYGTADVQKLKSKSEFRTEFEERVLELGNASNQRPTTMGTIFKNENNTKENNPVVLIPSKESGKMQIA